MTSNSSLLIPRVGLTIPLDPQEIYTTDSGQRQIRLKYNPDSDEWSQIPSRQPGFILWLNDSTSLNATHVRITKIMGSGRTAWGEVISLSSME